MKDKFSIEYLESPAWDIIGGGIQAYNTRQAGDDQGRDLCFVLKNEEAEIVGGVIGSTYWNWLEINLMWVRADLRRMGLGAKLLYRAEEEGRTRGAEFAFLDTFSFQALDFYKKQGYQVFGILEDFPPGHQRYYMKKALF